MAGQQRAKQIVQIFCILTALSLSAFTCQNGDDEKLGGNGKPHKPRPDDVATVGSDVCTYCHVVATEHWMTGAHANLEAINHTTHAPLDLGLLSDGFPYYDYLSDSSCAECHDPLGDGRNLVADLTGNVDRPVIGCESCHGGGAEHFGAGEIPYPKPAAEQCAQCHSSVFPDGHLTYHPNGDNIYEEYIQSPHAQSLGEHQLDEDTGDVRARCARCHTDEGFRKFQPLVPGTTGRLAFRAFFTDPVTDSLLWPNLPVADTNSITCRTCHNAHTTSKEQLAGVAPELIAGVTVSAEYNTCTQCHQLSGLDGNYMAGSTVGPYHYSDAEEQIPDTHAAVPGDTRLNSGPSEVPVFFVHKEDENSCAACHNPHLANLDINRQWRQSGHGDLLGDPWIHYDWKHAGRASCQRCHTSTGARNYLTALLDDPTGATYIAANNDFSMYVGLEAPAATRIDGNDQMETLYCWGCHSDYKGGLRNPGAFLAEWKDMDGVTRHQFPDKNGSNVCISCHSARESGGSIVAVADGATWTNLSFKNSHYLGAAETMFPGGGYQYKDGGGVMLNYANVSYYEHDMLGMGLLGSTVDAVAGTNGPCVACHMSSNPEKHLFQPVDMDGETITAITSNLCATCHNGEHEMTASDLQEMEEEFEESLQAMRYVLGQKGYWWGSGNPYIFTTDGGSTQQKNWTLACGATPAAARNTMGACFNMNFLYHEPGAFAHNRYYAKRLIYDSIDWMDNCAIDNSVSTTLNAIDGTTYTWKDAAVGYILSGSGGRP